MKRQGPEMVEIEKATLHKIQGKKLAESEKMPQIKNGDLMSSRIRNPNKYERKKQRTRKAEQTDIIRSSNLKPVIIRGASELKVDSGTQVHLPPISVNLEVRELLHFDKKRMTGSTNKKGQNRTKKHAREMNSNTETEPETKLPFLQLTQMRGQTVSESSLLDNSAIRKQLLWTNFTVLPPIGKLKSLSLGDVPEAISCKEEVEIENLENLGTAFETKEVTEVSEKNGTNDPYRQQSQPIILRTSVYLGTNKADEPLDLDDLNRKSEINRPKLPELPSEGNIRGTKRRNYQKDNDMDGVYERDMINWIRYQGRRFAICAETGDIYKDLPTIVKHNLLQQHLEEICIF